MDQFTPQRAQFLGRKRKPDFEEIRAARQPFQMLRPTERLAVIDGDGFKHPVAIAETAVGDRHGRLFLRNQLTIEQDKHSVL